MDFVKAGNQALRQRLQALERRRDSENPNASAIRERETTEAEFWSRVPKGLAQQENPVRAESSPVQRMESAIMAPSLTNSNDVDTMAVYERGFGIVELMDEILAHLPPKNIFALQRVSKPFHNHINGTTSTAKKVHLIPTAINTKFSTILKDPELRNCVPHLLPFTHKTEIDEEERRITINLKGQVDKLNLPYSWSKMLLTQPPLKQVWIKGRRIVDRGSHLPWFQKDEIDDGRTRMLLTRLYGIRLCDMIQAAQLLRSRCKVRSPFITFFATFDENGFVDGCSWDVDDADGDDANRVRVYEGLMMVSELSDGLEVERVMHEDWE